MTSIPTLLYAGAALVAIIAAASTGLAVVFGNRRQVSDAASTELIANLTKLRQADKEDFNRQIDELKKQINSMESKRKDDIQAIAHLQGQLDTYKDLPLKRWADSMEMLAGVNMKTEAQLITIADSNREILDINKGVLVVLQKSALIAATDRDQLLKPSQTITEQTVEHQIVKGRN